MFLNSARPGRTSIVNPSATRRYAVLFAFLLAGGAVAVAQRARADVPDDFPRFIVPGHEAQMASLRELFWEHYARRKGPASTLWDEWLSGSTLWPATEDGNLMHAMRADWRAALSGRFAVKALVASERSSRPAVGYYRRFMRGMLRKLEVNAKRQAARYADNDNLEASFTPGNLLRSGLLMALVSRINSWLPPEKVITLPL